LKNTACCWEWPVTHRDRRKVKRTSNEGRTKVGRKSNKCWMKRQDGKTVRRTIGCKAQDNMAWTNRPTRVRQKSDGCQTNQGRNDGNVVTCNATIAMALQLAMLLLLRLCYYDSAVAVATRCGTVVATALRLKFLFFFYSTTSGEKMKARKRKRSKIRNLFPGFIGWHNTSSFL